jgi:hypothetical protein
MKQTSSSEFTNDAKRLKKRIEASGIEHVTLNTGQLIVTRYEEVPTWAYETLRSVFPEDGACHCVPMPVFDDTHKLRVSRSGTNLLTTVIRSDDISVVTVGIGLRPDSSTRTWRLLHRTAQIPCITRPQDVPVRPWVAARFEEGLYISSLSFILTLGGFERCLAWAFVEHLTRESLLTTQREPVEDAH